MALIEMNGVTKKYHRSTTALRDINVSVNSGEFVYIVGPSGAGKSSFIKLLYREEKVSAGTLKVGEFNLTKLKKRDVPILRRSIGVVFQDYKLLPKKTVFMATHNKQIVDNLRHRVIAIEDGRIVRDEEEGEYGYND